MSSIQYLGEETRITENCWLLGPDPSRPADTRFLRQYLLPNRRRPLVTVHEAVIGNDAVDQSRHFLMYARVVAVIGPCDRGLDDRTVEDSSKAAKQKRFVMGTDGIGPCDSVVAVSDWPRASAPCFAEPRPS